MKSLDEIIDVSSDGREVKRALSVKMVLQGMSVTAVSELLTGSVQYVSKWKVQDETEGSDGLALGYQGSKSYLTEPERTAIMAWIKSHETLSVEQVRDYLAADYRVVYASKQSYYDLLEAGGMSYHKSEKQNPKRDEEHVQARREDIKKNWHPTVKLSNRVK